MEIKLRELNNREISNDKELIDIYIRMLAIACGLSSSWYKRQSTVLTDNDKYLGEDNEEI